jgi:hypothetical protein
MKKKQKRKLKKAMKQLTKSKNPQWVTALATVAAAVAQSFRNDDKRRRGVDSAGGTSKQGKERVKAPGRKREAEVPTKAGEANGIVMNEAPGPV